MEISEINIIGDFEAGMNCLQSPSFLSSGFPLSGIGKVSQIYSFCTWGALIFAIFTIINRIKILIITKLRQIKHLASTETLLQTFSDDYDFSDDDDSCSTASSEDNDDDDEEYTSTSSSENKDPVDQDFRVAGYEGQNCNLGLRRRCGGGERFSWSDFTAGKSVVKLWDSLSLGLEIEDSSPNVVSIWDLNKDQKIRSIFGGGFQIPAINMPSPAVVLSAGVNKGGNVVLGAFDTRIGGQIPAIYADWRQKPVGTAVGINSGGVKKVYVRDEITGALTFGDMRNVKTPLEESVGDTWWDADAVIVSDQFVDDSP